MHIYFIVNSKIKRHRAVINDIVKEFKSYNISIAETQYEKHAITLAADSVQNEHDFIVSVGGDGTLNEVLNGIMTASVPTNKIPVLGMIQKGTANDFSRSMHDKRSAKHLRHLIESRSYKKVDIGKVSFANPSLAPKYFINIAGLGLGPEVVQLMDQDRKILGSKISYFKSILQTFMKYERKTIACTADGWEWKGELLQLAIGNGKYFGNGICICPDAEVDDGHFNVSLFGGLSIMDYLRNLINLKKGVKIKHKEALYYSAKEVKVVSTTAIPCGIEVDGEYIGKTPAVISVVPKVIYFLR